MFDSCRTASGAAFASSVVMMFAVTAAKGGPVWAPAQDASSTPLVSRDIRSESWDELAGIEPSALPPLATNDDPTSASFVLATSSNFAEAQPHATVIPLPPGIWTGAAGLASLTAVAVLRSRRRS